jgi:4-amino-4-deoxy-L-arabinose transferase
MLHLTSLSLLLLTVGTIFFVVSFAFFQKSNEKMTKITLFLGTILIGFFIANLDPFLHLWDEQYHALVAKNLVKTPFHPKLYPQEILPYDFSIWSDNYTWLHKQPLFLWQIALSIKCFGVNALAVRIPSICMHGIATLFLYSIGKRIHSQQVGFYGALFFAVAFYPLQLVAGRFSTDHNDLAFGFYILGSFWAWVRYQENKQTKYLLFVGLFSGGALLVKWLVGLLIYAIWGIVLLTQNHWDKTLLKKFIPLFGAFALSMLVFIPWQGYILNQFPIEASHELALNARHFTEPIENHGGDYWFHWDAMKTIYGSGDLIRFIYLIGLVLLLKGITHRIHRIMVLSAILIVYTFYTLAATKMVAFTSILIPFFMLGLAALIQGLLTFFNKKVKLSWVNHMLQSVLVFFVVFFLFNFKEIRQKQTNFQTHDSDNRPAEIIDYEQTLKLNQILGKERYVIFNVNRTVNSHISTMFFTDYIAYPQIPSEKEIELVQSKNYPIAVIESNDLPDYIRNNKAITIVPIATTKSPQFR